MVISITLYHCVYTLLATSSNHGSYCPIRQITFWKPPQKLALLELDQTVVTVNKKKLRLIGTHRFCSEKKLWTEDQAPWADMHYKREASRGSFMLIEYNARQDHLERSDKKNLGRRLSLQ